MKKIAPRLISLFLSIFLFIQFGYANTLNEKYRFEDFWEPPNNDGVEVIGDAFPMIILSENVDGEFILKKNEGGLPDGLLGYCFNYDKHYPESGNGEMYSPLVAVDEIYGGESGYLRAILYNGFPYKSIDEIEANTGIQNLSPEMATNATQFAIWYYTDGLSLDEWKNYFRESLRPKQEEEALFTYLINLNPMESSNTYADIELLDSQQVYLNENNDLVLSITYQVTGSNYDGSEIAVEVILDDDTKIKYPNAIITQNEINNEITLTIPNASFDTNTDVIEIGLKFNFNHLIEDLFISPPTFPDQDIQNIGAVTINTVNLHKNKSVSFTKPEPTPEPTPEPEQTQIINPNPTPASVPEQPVQTINPNPTPASAPNLELDQVPKTGGTSLTFLWFSLMICSLVGLSLVFLISRKR